MFLLVFLVSGTVWVTEQVDIRRGGVGVQLEHPKGV